MQDNNSHRPPIFPRFVFVFIGCVCWLCFCWLCFFLFFSWFLFLGFGCLMSPVPLRRSPNFFVRLFFFLWSWISGSPELDQAPAEFAKQKKHQDFFFPMELDQAPRSWIKLRQNCQNERKQKKSNNHQKSTIKKHIQKHKSKKENLEGPHPPHNLEFCDV